MKLSELNKISDFAEIYMDPSHANEKDKYGEILLLFLSFLGYTENCVLAGGAFNMASEQTFQYALKIYDDNSSDRIYIRMHDFGENLTDHDNVINETIVAQQNIEGITKYYILTNGIIYRVFSNTPTGMNLVNIKEEGTFNIASPEKKDYALFEKLSLKSLRGESQRLEIDDDLEFDEEPEEEIEEEPKKEEPPKEKKEIKLPAFDEKTIGMLKKIALIILAIIILLLIFKFLTANPTSSPQPSETNVNIGLNSNSNTNKAPDNSLITINSNLENISAVLDLSVSSLDTLSIKFLSNLEEGSVVKLGIFCGDNSNYSYQKIDATGSFNGSFQIPETWGEQKVTVGAYLRFDEKGYSQPKNVTDKYGTTGEKINWNPEYSANMLTYSEVNHSNSLVEALLKRRNEERELQIKNAFEKDFSTIDTRVDAFGNIKHVPAGFSFDETNITESRNIYPMIYYDKASNTSYFYIICGYAGTQFVRFEDVTFSCDGYNWKYERGTNEKRNKIVGNKKAEWIYFDNVNTPQLLNDMALLANSSDTSMYLVGATSPQFNVTVEDKASINQFLAIYDTYYGNGTYVPDVSLFQTTGSSVSLSYIREPLQMRERGSSELESLALLQNSMTQKKLNDETISKEDEDLLDMMKKTYRPISKTMREKIFNSIKTAEPISVYYEDYETGKKFFKIYFVYAQNGEIEDGYIPYINVYEDRSVLVPIKSITARTTSSDKVYAKYTITQTFYNELQTYFANTNYEQFDD